MPSLCVIVPTYKRPQDLADLLVCLKPQIEQEPDRRLVIVNDGTHDETYAQVVRRHLTWMTYIPAPTNGGPGAARNIAAREAKEDFIVMTDDDCRPPLTWLDHIQGRLEADPWLDGLAGYTRAYFTNPKSLKERLIAESRVLPGATYDEIGRLTCAVTAAFAVRRSFYEQVGGFDERFRPSGEDLDLTQRLLRAGAIIEADPTWWTGHTTDDTLKAYFKRYFTYGEGSARYAFTRQDWLHPDLRNYLEDDDAERAVRNWASSWKTTAMGKSGNLIEKLLIAWFIREVAESYAAGFAAGAEKFAPAGVAVPGEPWLRWPRLGLAPDGLLRR